MMQTQDNVLPVCMHQHKPNGHDQLDALHDRIRLLDVFLQGARDERTGNVPIAVDVRDAR